MLSMNPGWIAAPTMVTGLAGLAAYAAVNPRSQLFGQSIFATNAARKLALTFDDGPNPSLTPKLLDLLARHNAKATFFVIGKYAAGCPELLKDIYARGHGIGNHTYHHPNLFFCGKEETDVELRRCSETIESVLWEAPRFFRPPFGFRAPWTAEIAHGHNLQMVTWSLLPGDWKPKSVEWLTEKMRPIAVHAKNLKSQNAPHRDSGTGDILCLHDGDYRQQNSDRLRTLAALEYWLPRLRDLGLEFVTMTEAEKESA